MSGWPLSPTFRRSFVISTVSIFEVVPSGIGTLTVTSFNDYSQSYLSVLPPFASFGFCFPAFSSSSSFFSSSSPAAAALVAASLAVAAAGFAFFAASCASISAASSSVISTVCASSALAAASAAARSAAALSAAALRCFSIYACFALSALNALMCFYR